MSETALVGRDFLGQVAIVSISSISVHGLRPLGRQVDPREVARAVAYLASAQCALMTSSNSDFDQTIPGAQD